jgi:WD40 repeat protein
MFAAAMGTSYVYIYNFYTGENPSNLQCKGHQSKVRGIDWFEDDMGFTSCALDGNVYFYDLQQQKESNQRNQDKDFN